jgi:hypothetical protein
MDSVVLDDSFPKDTQPPEIKIPLKTHQLTLVKKCSELENSSQVSIKLHDTINNTESELKSTFGIIGDIVGSGKTLTILALIAKQNVLKNKLPKMMGKGTITCTEISLGDFNVEPYNIIVVPHTIYKQWITTIEEFTTLKYYGINNKKSFDAFKEIFTNEETAKEFNSKIILVSNTRFSDFNRLNLPYWIQNSHYSRYIFDEADVLKISGYDFMRNCSFMWFVTSSYKTLLNPYARVVWKNSNGETSDYYNYDAGFNIRSRDGGLIHSGFIKNYMTNISSFPNKYKQQLVLRNSDEFVRSAFNLPDYITHSIKCKMPYYLKILDKNVSQDIINHINAGDLKGAIEKVDCAKFNEHDLIKGITRDLEIKLENLQIEFDMKSKMTFSTEKAKDESLQNIHIKMGKIKDKINSIQEKLKSSQMCAICYDDLNSTSVSPCCNTKYCFGCISTWLHQNKHCPFCRAKIDFNSLIIVTDEHKPIKETELLLTKLDNLKIVIEKQMSSPNFKMLIFSEYYNTFEPIETLIKSYGIKYANVMGTTNTINKTLRLYKETDSPDKIDILLLHANYCANGINLENSSDIVLYHSMNKDTTTQIIGRGQRPGRTDTLNVWNLCYDNEL